MYLTAKRLLDIFLSLFGLILLSPLLVIAALLIKLDSEGPVFYRGVRVGKNGKHFRMYKLHAMVVSADQTISS
jgi:lipopolysaccharide/colanic/teichoic acid biosynthesis glycosyltransferase